MVVVFSRAATLMPGVCSICSHAERQTIDEALVGAVPYRDIAGRHGVTPSSLTRHRKGHLSPAIVAVQAERNRDAAVSVADRVDGLYDRASAILLAAESGKQAGLSLAAIRELRALCELLARLTGELDERPQTLVVNLQTSPEWLDVRTKILAALAVFPDARAAVVAALEPGRRVIEGEVVE
ncbi:MAG TPA: hypothetical protein VGL39_11455 [Jatrophihabitantaceae bacterium]